MQEKFTDDTIRAYLKGKLEDSTRHQFEKTLANDPHLASDVAVYQAEMAASELLIAAETRQLFREWQTETTIRDETWQGIHYKKWIVGLAILLLLIAGLWVLQRLRTSPIKQNETPVTAPEIPASNSPVSPAEAAPPVAENKPPKPTSAAIPTKQYAALALEQLPDPIRSNIRGAADTVISVFSRAQVAFAAGKYQQTLDLLAQTDSTRQQSAAFLAAHALFRLRRFSEAEAQFTRLIAQNSRQYRYPAEWGLLMCRLAVLPQQQQAFQQQLEGILAQPEHPYFEQAEKLQRQVRGVLNE